MNFIQQAYKGSNDWWMYVLTFVTIFIAIQFASIPLLFAAYFAVDGDMTKFREGAQSNFMDSGINSNLFLALMIFSVIGFSAGANEDGLTEEQMRQKLEEQRLIELAESGEEDIILIIFAAGGGGGVEP